MLQIKFSIKVGRFSKDYIFNARFIFIQNKTNALKPYQLNRITSVGKYRNKPLLRTFAHFFEPDNLPFNLNKRHFFGNLVQVIIAAAVDVFVGIMPQQIFCRMNVEFFRQQFCLFRSNTGQKFYVLIGEIHFIILKYSFLPALFVVKKLSRMNL